MLKKLRLTNFQRHRNLEAQFGSGLTAVTASNERGKTSMMRAIAYALFGTKSLSEPLDALVSWGEPVNSLKVELAFEVDGIDYVITRSKGAAELRYEGESVTGQTETAKFISELLGADAALAANLIIAGQNEIRGSLSTGKGAIQLIEKLADFEQIDQLIELLQVHLTTGSTTAAKLALGSAQAVLDEAEEPAPLNTAALQQELTTLQETVDKLRAEADKANTDAADAAKARDQALATTQRQRDLAVKIEDRTAALERLKADEPELAPWSDVDEGALGAVEREETELQESVRLLQERGRGETLNHAITAEFGDTDDPDHERFDGEAEVAEEARHLAETAALDADRAASKARAKAAAKRALIVRDSCSLCGKDVSEIPEVIAKNEALEIEAVSLETEAMNLDAKATLERSYERRLQGVLNAHQRLKALEGRNWTLDGSLTPGVLVWMGGRAEEGDDRRLQGVKEDLQRLRQIKASHEESLRARKAHKQRVERAESELQALIDEQAALPPAPDLDALRGAVTESEERRRRVSGAYTSAMQEHSQRSVEVQRLIAEHSKLVDARARAQAEVATRTEELARLEFNNALLKAVREARPVVANKLWALVLGAVSEFFSAMRGQPSTVTRGPEGFMVDGHPASTLSGSTKDILGLAIRVALTRTFLPGISLLMLDEPNAAMDDERTANVLGFLGGVGFNQIVVVSHDEMTVDVADHVVTLE